MANDAVKGGGIVRWRRCGWYPLLSAHLAPRNQGFPPGSAFPIALAGPRPWDLLSRVSKNHKPCREGRLGPLRPDHSASRTRGRRHPVLRNELVAHERDLPPIRRPAGHVDRPLTAKQPCQDVDLLAGQVHPAESDVLVLRVAGHLFLV